MTLLVARGAARAPVLLASLVCLAVLGVVATPVRAQPQLTRALTDDVWFDADGGQWVPRAVATGSRIVLLGVDWAEVAPHAPNPAVDPTSPSDPQYDFSYIDAVLRKFAGSGISPAFLVLGAPRWAEAPGGPEALEAAGAWEPDAAAYGQFATALGRRYSGSYPDPLRPGRPLPRVRYFQAWGEANLAIHLAPQWIKHGGKWVPFAPRLYRSMLNAFYAGIKKVHADNVVITEGSAPFGDPPGKDPVATARMPPVTFVSELFCMHGAALHRESCPNPADFDVLAMDPYELNSPTWHAFNVGDVSAPDLGKLTRLENRALKLGLALPRGHKGLWVTEFSYDSNPPNPTAVSTQTQARWLEESFYIFWKEGVSTVVWYLIRDRPPGNWSTDYYSGVYFRNGQPKPSFEAFRFPFVVMPSGSRAIVWGIAPRSGTLAVQHQVGRGWKTLFHLNVKEGNVFLHTISASLRGDFRGDVNGEHSLGWKR